MCIMFDNFRHFIIIIRIIIHILFIWLLNPYLFRCNVKMGLDVFPFNPRFFKATLISFLQVTLGVPHFLFLTSLVSHILLANVSPLIALNTCPNRLSCACSIAVFFGITHTFFYKFRFLFVCS